MPRPPGKIGGRDDTNIGSDYSPAETEFMLACHHWRRGHDNRMPDCREVLSIAKSLGYEKPQQENLNGTA